MNNLHISLTEFLNESRVLKQTHSLLSAEIFKRIDIIALHAEGLKEFEVIDQGRFLHRMRLRTRFLPRFLPFQIFKFIELFFRIILFVSERRPRVITLHTLLLLPLGVLLKWFFRVRLVYDAHELETEVNGLKGFRKRLAKLVERHLINYCDAVCVVNQSISDWYQSNYKLEKIWVVRNMPYRLSAPPKKNGSLRKLLGVNSSEALIFLYQGVLSPGRGIEIMLEVFSRVVGDKYLVCMGYGPHQYLVESAAHLYPNIYFLPAVPPDQIKEYTVDADIGLSVIENTCLSYFLCLPNKLYEYVACGVVPIVSNFPELASFVDDNDCGWKVEPNAMALGQLIDTISAESISERQKNILRAGAVFCWENEEINLLQMYQSLDIF